MLGRPPAGVNAADIAIAFHLLLERTTRKFGDLWNLVRGRGVNGLVSMSALGELAMRAVAFVVFVGVVVGGSTILPRLRGSEADAGASCESPPTMKHVAHRSRSDLSPANRLRVGVLLGRLHEAADRDVAPSVLVTRLQNAEVFLVSEATPVRDVIGDLLEQLAQTNSPEQARSLLADAVSRLSSAPEPPADFSALPTTWLGTWETTYGTMVLGPGEKGTIVGSYGAAEYEVFGEVNADDPSVLEGRWVEGGTSGRFRFRLIDAGAWEGHWASGDLEPSDGVNWTATRVADPTALKRWVGQWQTSYGTMTLSVGEGGRTIDGWYGTPTNRVVGWTDPSRPDVLVGYWYYENTTASGRLEFRLTGHASWTGGWSSGVAEPSPGSWTGTRVLDPLDSRDRMEEVGPSEGSEAGSVAAGDYGVLLGEE